MTYQDLVAKVKGVFEKAGAHGITEHVAVQINVEGEAEGIFYLEVADGSVKVEPYDYRDRDLLIVTSAATLTEIAEGKISGVEAAESGRLRAEGNFEKAGQLRALDVQKVEPVAESAEKAEEPAASESEEEVKAEPVAEKEEEPEAIESTEEVKAESVTESVDKAKEPPKAEEPEAGGNAEVTEKPVIESAEEAQEEAPAAESAGETDEPPKTEQPAKTPGGRQMSRKQRKKWKKKKNS